MTVQIVAPAQDATLFGNGAGVQFTRFNRHKFSLWRDDFLPIVGLCVESVESPAMDFVREIKGTSVGGAARDRFEFRRAWGVGLAEYVAAGTLTPYRLGSEQASSSSVIFLDLTVSLDSGAFYTKTYKKPGFAPQYLAYSSNHSKACKDAIYKGEVVRHLLNCSLEEDYDSCGN